MTRNDPVAVYWEAQKKLYARAPNREHRLALVGLWALTVAFLAACGWLAVLVVAS
jgi:hypothetical protein